MLYGFFSRGYKPGGLNPAIPVDFQSSSAFSFDQEEIEAFEIGAKSTLLDGQMVLNGAFYVYDYKDLQVSRIVNNSSINENIDADIMGLELEAFWQPDFAPGLMIDFGYAWTDTEVVDATSIDPTNRTAGDPDWLTFNNTDSGANTGVNFIANQTSAGYDAAVLACGALPGVAALAYPDGTPALQSKNCLDGLGVGVSDGLATDISGNNLPNTPEHSIKLGAAYTWNINAISGDLTLRWDYYWQDDSFGREFNTVGDQIDSWDQHNMQLIYESLNGKWQARLWVRNLEDEDNVTGHYLTSDTSGFYRNWFLTEPRIWGASVRWMFGN
jgi:outer membrane receptor protein involved in Fe transport